MFEAILSFHLDTSTSSLRQVLRHDFSVFQRLFQELFGSIGVGLVMKAYRL